MKIQMKTAMRFADGVAREGDVLEFDKGRAVALVNAGYAKWVVEPEEAEAPEAVTFVEVAGVQCYDPREDETFAEAVAEIAEPKAKRDK